MLITVKTLKHETFKVEVDESDKILTIKEKIAESQGHPVSSQKLIFSGKFATSYPQRPVSKILADENPVSQYNITEKDFLVIMVTK
ncbi:UV excision repair protein rad23, partial [Dissophora globulifera]